MAARHPGGRCRDRSRAVAVLWTVFTRFNPADDIYAETHVLRNAISYSLPIVIDARMKPGYPEELVPHEDTVELVNRNWNRYFPLV
jgi:3-polyprenyl-4-hydroxybenzoate decarboxylase